jgi:hypothetical protein
LTPAALISRFAADGFGGGQHFAPVGEEGQVGATQHSCWG